MAELSNVNIEELGYEVEPKEYKVLKKLNLREEPSTDAEIVRVMEAGEKIMVVYEEGEWAATEEGFCMKKFLG